MSDPTDLTGAPVAGGTTPATGAPAVAPELAAPALDQKRRLPELMFAVFLVIVGIVIAVDSMNLHVLTTGADPLGPKAMPYIVAGLLVVTGIALFITVLRGNLAQGDEGEDVDLSQPSDWSTLLPLLGFFMLTIVIIDWAGWVIAGTILFFGSVISLGGRRYILTLVVSLIMSVGTFYGFYLGLGIKLPAGLLEGVL